MVDGKTEKMVEGKTETKLVHLDEGSKVDRWTIHKLLGEGAFGAVYQVTDSKGDLYALKTESASVDVQILKMEVYVLSALEKKKSRHFCKIEDKGRWGSFYYMVMTLVGKCLTDLRKAQPHEHLSMGTAIGTGIQAIEALHELHSIGYLHRDVKPGNFTVGRPDANDLRKIYVLDFGMCRRFIDKNGVIRRPRTAAGFRGTARYAPLSCHVQRELCRKDDLESWLYMQVELTTGNLPWNKMKDLMEVAKCKKRCRTDPEMSKMFEGCPPELKEVMRMIDALKYYDAPPYKKLCETMKQSFTSMKVEELPYDWEKPGGGIL